MNTECSCEEWKKSMKALNACTNSAWVHGVQYTGKQFKYCPWCSTKLRGSNDRTTS